MRKIISTTLFSFLLLLSGCSYFSKTKLPVYGNKTAVTGADSLDYKLPDFELVDQEGHLVNTSTIQNKVFVAEFFFTSCPSICPKMQAEMLRFYEKYKDNPDVLILAFTIDPARDSVPTLKKYAHKLNIETSKWHLLTGNKDSIYALAENFLVSASEDPDAPGGHVHSGNFILVDKQRRLRGYYDGVNEESVAKLLAETDILLDEK